MARFVAEILFFITMVIRMTRECIRVYVNIIFIFCFFDTYGQIGIGTSNPKPTSILEVSSNSKGVIFPRLNKTQRNNVVSPADGLTIYNTDYGCLNVYRSDEGWTTLGDCDYSCEFTFSNIIEYHGVSKIDSLGVAYYQDFFDEKDTIRIEFTSSGVYPYSFRAYDETYGLEYSASGNSQIGSNIVALIPNALQSTFYGETPLEISGGANVLVLNPRVDIVSLSAYETVIVDVGIDIDNADGDNDPTTGTFEQVWMDRNLGAYKTADSVEDPLSYGNYYQWGRGNDGHERVVVNGANASNILGLNNVINTLSSTDQPLHGDFIITTGDDWRSPSNNSLWQGINGINNPCPSGYRLPTSTEIQSMISALSITDDSSAVESVLHIPAAGIRNSNSGVITNLQENINGNFSFGDGYLWTSSSLPSQRIDAHFFSYSTNTEIDFPRATGLPVRCIKD